MTLNVQLWCEYSNLTDLRASGITGGAQIDLGVTKDDAFLLGLMRSVSRRMEGGGRWFYPQILTRYFDRAGGRQLDLPESDLLEVTTVTNGDGSVVAASSYDLLDYNVLPYYAVRLKLTSGIVWLVDSQGNSEKAISVTGTWGFIKDQSAGWLDSTTTLNGAISTTTATTFTSSSGAALKSGWLMQVDTEMMYLSSVSSNTATVIRGVNGSTAATHLTGATVRYWMAGWDLEDVCRQATQALYKLRTNPLGDTIAIPGMGTFQTPKDVNKWLDAQMESLGYAQLY